MPAARFVGRLALVLAWATTLVSSASAQDARSWLARWEDSSAAAVMRGLGSNAALRQVRGPLPATVLDAIADSLVQRVLRPVATSANDRFIAALYPIESLVFSGRPEEGGVPYAGAQAQLIRIVEQTDEPRIARSVMRQLLGVGPLPSAIDYLVRKALQPDTVTAGNATLALYQAWEPGMINQRPTTAAELDLVRAGLKRIWEGTWPQTPQGGHLTYSAGLQLSRAACLEGWYQPAAVCARIAPVKRVGDTLGRGGR